MEDHCVACGYDGRSLGVDTVASAVGELPSTLGALLAGAGEAQLRRRPGPGWWSALEYTGHLRDLMGFHRWVIERALAEEVPSIGGADPDAAVRDAGYADADPGALLAQLERRVARLCALAGGLDEAAQRRRVVVEEVQGPISTLFVARSALHEATHHLLDVERILGGP